MARTGVEPVIKQLRVMTNAGTADFSVAGQQYWSDDDLEETLDSHRIDIFREPLVQIITHNNAGSAEYFDYFFHWSSPEQATSGTVNGQVIWEVENSAGSVIGTANYTVNYEAQHIRFTNSQAGTNYLLNYRYFNVNRAAANIWRRKASIFAERFDVATDNHKLTRSQLIKHCLDMAKQYESSDPRMVTTRRVDVAPNAHQRGAFSIKV